VLVKGFTFEMMLLRRVDVDPRAGFGSLERSLPEFLKKGGLSRQSRSP
jgi:hypothetical protein